MELQLSDFKSGMRVKSHPASDLFMQGIRYGKVQRIGRKFVTVEFDRGGKWRRVLPRNLTTVVEEI